MRLDQKVTVPAHVDDVWKLLDDTTYDGSVKVAIGPLSMNHTGTVSIEERSEPDRRIVLLASGRDRRGSGTAKAHVTVLLVPDGDGTGLEVGTDLQLTGRIAALGRGVHDVANRLFAEFADHLAAQLEGSSPAAEPQAPQRVSAGSELKILPLLLSVTRERLAAFLLRLSERVKP